MPPGDSRPSAGGRPGYLHALALLCAFAAELAVFRASTSHFYAWTYPRWADQLQYLREAYGSYDKMAAHGFWAGARDSLAIVSPQGCLHGFFALLVFSIAGPSRGAALAVNLLAFIALQLATFVAVRRISRSWAFAWAAVGLLAAMHSPWSGDAGSAADFRLDWMAACAYGVALAAAVASDGFRSLRGSVLFGAAVGVTLLVRHLTAVYFGFVYAGLAVWLLFQHGGWRRYGCLVFSGFFALAISAWAFWRSWASIYSYYWVTRFVGPESSLRDSHMNPPGYARWLCAQVFFQQLGFSAALLGAAAAVVFLFSRRPRERRNETGPGLSGTAFGAWPVVIAFMAAPAVVLYFHPEKAPAPLNIMIPGVAWTIILALLWLARRVPRRTVAVTCSAVAVAGGIIFVSAEARNPHSHEAQAEFRDVNALADFLYFRAEEAGLSRPRVAVTGWPDGVAAGSFEMLGRERHGRLLHFVPELPTGLLATERETAMVRLSESDFVCLVTRAPILWPFDRQMADMLPEMRRWCDGNLRHDGDVEAAGFAISVYERPILEHPPGGTGVALASMIGAGAKGPANAAANPPGRPIFAGDGVVPWSTEAGFSYFVRAAYSPISYRAVNLPEGLEIVSSTGEIHGRFALAGTYVAKVSAANALGSVDEAITFRVSGDEWGAQIDPPAKASVGIPVEIGYSAYDTKGTLDFIDVTDLTLPKVLARVPANEDQRSIWTGTFPTTFQKAGLHTVIFRFVRFEPGGAGKYTFTDRQCQVDVAP
jgi:hypothetical protein